MLTYIFFFQPSYSHDDITDILFPFAYLIMQNYGHAT